MRNQIFQIMVKVLANEGAKFMKTDQVCQAIVKILVNEGYKFQVSHNDLERAIMKTRGIDERTVKRWIKALETFDYIKRKSLFTWTLNPVMIPELMRLLKEKPQTKMM